MTPTYPRPISESEPLFPCELYYPGDKNTEAFWSPTLHEETWRKGMIGFTHWRPLSPVPTASPSVAGREGVREAVAKGIEYWVNELGVEGIKAPTAHALAFLGASLTTALAPVLDRHAQQWRLSSVCREKEAEVVALNDELALAIGRRDGSRENVRILETLVAKQKKALRDIEENTCIAGTDAGDAYAHRAAAVALALTPANVSDELAESKLTARRFKWLLENISVRELERILPLKGNTIGKSIDHAIEIEKEHGISANQVRIIPDIQ